jgi:hypothetical protein
MLSRSKQNTLKENKMSAISDKLVKVNENFTINRHDNGFMIEVGGRDDNDDWKSAKVIVSTEDELIEVIKEALSLPVAE